MELHHSYQRQFYPFGFLVTEQARAPLPPAALPALLDALLTHVLPADALALQPVLDLKGGDPPDAPALLKRAPEPEELLYVAGRYLLYDEASKEVHDQDFSIRLRTSFLEFAGSAHIRNSVHLDEEGALSSVLPLPKSLPLLGRVFPLEVRCLRVSFDLFEGLFLGLFGFAPVATQHILIEATQEQLYLKLIREGAPTRDSSPLRDERLYARIRGLLVS